jgi:hypothetical protein
VVEGAGHDGVEPLLGRLAGFSREEASGKRGTARDMAHA